MTLQIAKGAIIGQYVESVLRSLERVPWLVSPVLAIPNVRPQHREAFLDAHLADACYELIIR